MSIYDDVPFRLVTGEAVPVSEIIAYLEPMSTTEAKSILFWMKLTGILSEAFEDGTKKFTLTPFGQTVRTDFIVRLDEECPECP